ncbi:MAG TPA: hypothetical protein VEF76_01025 [Patescibacteria group bacterium]|nr:hypothetical protein [Patescibacteria group bacterium]
MSLWDIITGTTNELSNERHKAVLKGDEKAIAALKSMDKKIGKLTAKFNGIARVPPEVTKQVDDLIRQNAVAMTKVRAFAPYEEDTTERIGSFLRNETPVTEQEIKWLEYVNRFKSPNGAPIEQRVAQFKVGP